MFRKEISQKNSKWGWADQFRGVIQPWAHQESSRGSNSSPGRACCFKLKPLARLGELGGKLLLHFSYKMALEVEGKGFSTFGNQISLKICEEKKKEGENQVEALPWCFRDQYREHSSSFFIRSSFILRRSSIFNRLVFDLEALNPFLLCMFWSSYRLILVFFFFILSEFRPIV